MKKVFIVFTAAIIGLASCKKEDNNPQPQPGQQDKPFSYLKTGNRWVYDFIYNGTVVDSLTIAIKNESNGEYQVETKDMVQTEIAYHFVDGDYMKRYTQGQTKSDAVRVGKANPKQSETWTEFDGKDSIKTTITQLNVPVTVAAGTFTCTAVETVYKSNNLKYTSYIDAKNYLIKLAMTYNGQPAGYELRGKNF